MLSLIDAGITCKSFLGEAGHDYIIVHRLTVRNVDVLNIT